MTRRTFQPALGPLKIESSSPERLHTGSSLENFDNMSAQSSDSVYSAQRHHRQNSSWTSTSHYNELVSPYSSQQRTPCAMQTHYPQPKPEPSLPSIHYLTDNTGYPSAPYAYGTTGGAYNDHRNYTVKAEPSYPLKSETASYYDASSRYGQHHPQVNRAHATTMDYQRYPSMMFDYTKGYCPTPYSVEYLPSPTSSQHPVSPTASNGDGCGISHGRRRRGNLPKQITDYLKGWFMEHLDHPYPTEEEKQVFVQQTRLSIAQVCPFYTSHYDSWLISLLDRSAIGSSMREGDICPRGASNVPKPPVETPTVRQQSMIQIR